MKSLPEDCYSEPNAGPEEQRLVAPMSSWFQTSGMILFHLRLQNFIFFLQLFRGHMKTHASIDHDRISEIDKKERLNSLSHHL